MQQSRPQTSSRAQVMALFAGQWSIRRDILDLDSEWLGRLEGQAVFEPDGDSVLAYHEEGRLKFGGLEDVKATRSYRWHFGDDNKIHVHFSDDAPFHTFEFTDGRAESSHYCDPDMYEVAYEFGKWPLWRAEWRVEGPRKDYRMVTIYEKPSGLLPQTHGRD